MIVVSFCWLVAMVQYSQQAAVMPSNDGFLHVYGLPVGQGDGTIIQCPNGDIAIVDLGSTTRTQKEGNYMTDDELTSFLGSNVNRLKYVFISHADKDHYNLFLKLNLARPRTVETAYVGCSLSDYPSGMTTWIATNARNAVGGPAIGTTIQICGPTSPVIVRVLASNTDTFHPSKQCTNGDSLVLRLEYGTFKLFLPGDVEDYDGFQYDQNGYITSDVRGFKGKPGILRTIIDNWKGSGGIASDVYRFAHHGTWPNGNKKFFIQAVRPSYAFSSSKLPGTDGTYDHPHCDLYDAMIQMYNARQIPLALTTAGVNQQIEYFCGKANNRYLEDHNIYGIYTTAAISNGGQLVNWYVKVDSDGRSYRIAPYKWR